MCVFQKSFFARWKRETAYQLFGRLGDHVGIEHSSAMVGKGRANIHRRLVVPVRHEVILPIVTQWFDGWGCAMPSSIHGLSTISCNDIVGLQCNHTSGSYIAYPHRNARWLWSPCPVRGPWRRRSAVRRWCCRRCQLRPLFGGSCRTASDQSSWPP